MPIREHPVDACPGALRVHQALDGGLARIRVPGGQLSAPALLAVADAAEELGDGTIELTSRANLQVRGLAPDAEAELGARLAAAGLLPSATHERVRNIIASPLAGPVIRGVVREVDAELCARPGLAELPGRFLFAVDDGRGDVAWLDADIAAVFSGTDTAAILLAGREVGERVARELVPATMLACAEGFLAVRGEEWRIAELEGGPERVARHAMNAPFAAPAALNEAFIASPGPLGRIVQPDGLVAMGAAVPLGRLTPAHSVALAGHHVVITPWRGVVVPDLPPEHADPLADRLRAAGFLLDPDGPGVGVGACAGSAGCAKALADVRADAAAMVASGTRSTVPVHWSGCARRCGRPRGDAIDVVATDDGYTVTREVR